MAELQKPKQYNWVMEGKHVTCAAGPGSQDLVSLWEAEELTEFHDAELARATKAVNAILEKIQKNDQDPSRTLSFIEFQSRHLLVWATYGAITPYDDDSAIIKALKLKTK